MKLSDVYENRNKDLDYVIGSDGHELNFIPQFDGSLVIEVKCPKCKNEPDYILIGAIFVRTFRIFLTKVIERKNTNE